MDTWLCQPETEGAAAKLCSSFFWLTFLSFDSNCFKYSFIVVAVFSSSCVAEVMPLVKTLQLLFQCEMCDKNKVLLLRGALGPYGHWTAMPKAVCDSMSCSRAFHQQMLREEGKVTPFYSNQQSHSHKTISPNLSLLSFTDDKKTLCNVKDAVWAATRWFRHHKQALYKSDMWVWYFYIICYVIFQYIYGSLWQGSKINSGRRS